MSGRRSFVPFPVEIPGSVGESGGESAAFVPVTMFGAEAGVRATDASIVASTNALSSASLIPAAAGDPIVVLGAGPGGLDLLTTIVSATAGHAVLAATASTTVTDGVAVWGPDNSEAFAKGIAAAVAQGFTLWIPGGLYAFTSGIELSNASGLSVWQSPDATIQSLIPDPGVGNASSLFYSQFQPDPLASPPFTTFAANNAVGGTTVSLNAAPPVGSEIYMHVTLSDTDYGIIRRVIGVTGSGPFTVTVDAPVPFPFFTTTSTVFVVATRPQNITWYGNKGTWTGRAAGSIGGANARIWECLGGLNISVLDVNVNQSGGGNNPATAFYDPLMNWDEACRNCWWINCTIDFPSGLIGFGTESSEQCGMWHCQSENIGYAIYDGIDFEMHDCKNRGNSSIAANYGLFIGTNGSYQSVGVKVFGGSYNMGPGTSGFSQIGIDLQNSTDTTIYGADCSDNAYVGIYVSALAVNASIFGGSVAGCGNTGLYQEPLTVNTRVEGLDITSSVIGTIAGAQTFGEISGSLYAGPGVINLPPLHINGGLADLQVNFSNLTDGGLCVYCHGGRSVIRGHIAISNSAPLTECVIVDNGAVAEFEDFTIDGAGVAASGCVGIVSVAGTTVRMGNNVNVDACSLPTVIAGFCSKSLGGGAPNNPIVATAATPVAVPWPDLKTTERVFLSMHTKGGAPSALPLITYTPGTGFSLTSYSGDTSTYDYEVR